MCIDHDPYQTQAPEGRKVYMGTCCQTPVNGVQETVLTVFYIPVAPLVLRCDLPKPRGRKMYQTKLTPMVRFPNRTYRPGNKTNPVNLVLFVILL